MSVFAVLWLYNRTDRRWQEHGRTEVVRHGADPSFARSFYLRYNQNSNPLTYEATDQARALPPAPASPRPCSPPPRRPRRAPPEPRPRALQWVRIQVFQRNSTLPNLSNHILHGQVKFTLRAPPPPLAPGL